MPVLQATPIYIGREVCQLILAPPLTLPSDRCGTLEQRRKPIVLNDLALALFAPGPSNQSSASTRAPDAAARCGEWSFRPCRRPGRTTGKAQYGTRKPGNPGQ